MMDVMDETAAPSRPEAQRGEGKYGPSPHELIAQLGGLDRQDALGLLASLAVQRCC